MLPRFHDRLSASPPSPSPAPDDDGGCAGAPIRCSAKVHALSPGTRYPGKKRKSTWATCSRPRAADVFRVVLPCYRRFHTAQ